MDLKNTCRVGIRGLDRIITGRVLLVIRFQIRFVQNQTDDSYMNISRSANVSTASCSLVVPKQILPPTVSLSSSELRLDLMELTWLAGKDAVNMVAYMIIASGLLMQEPGSRYGSRGNNMINS
jgi:hypothetical protein